MRPDHLLLVWVATYAAEYVRMETARCATSADASSWAAITADRAVYELKKSGRKPNIEGYEKL